jgi:hypothetical protein
VKTFGTDYQVFNNKRHDPRKGQRLQMQSQQKSQPHRTSKEEKAKMNVEKTKSEVLSLMNE